MSDDGVSLTWLNNDAIEVAVTYCGETESTIVQGETREIVTRAIQVAHQNGLVRGIRAERESRNDLAREEGGSNG